MSKTIPDTIKTATLVLWFSLLPVSALPDIPPNTAVRFRLVRDFVIVVPVWINGQGPFDFMLDTGTNTTVIYQTLASQLALEPTDRLELVTANGSQIVPRARLRQLTLGRQTVTELEAIITDLHEIRSLDSRLCGVVGQNFLARFNYLVSYPEKMIWFEQKRELEQLLIGERLPVTDDEGRLLLTAAAASSLRLILDSGASDVLLFAKASQPCALPIRYAENQFAEMTTAAHRQRVARGELPVLRLGSQILKGLSVAVLTLPRKAAPRREDGLLPTRLFRAIYFGNRSGFVMLNPRRTGKVCGE